MSVCWFVLLPVSLYVSTSLENDWIFFSKTLHIWTFEILLKWSESLKILTPVGFFVPIFVGFFLSHFLLLWWSLHKKNQSMVLSAGSPFGVSWDSYAFLYFLITIQYFFFSVLQWWSFHVKRFFMLFTPLLGPITLEYIPYLLGNFRVFLDPFLFNIFSLYFLQLLLVLGQP